jgi:hypothetical protein
LPNRAHGASLPAVQGVDQHATCSRRAALRIFCRREFPVFQGFVLDAGIGANKDACNCSVPVCVRWKTQSSPPSWAPRGGGPIVGTATPYSRSSGTRRVLRVRSASSPYAGGGRTEGGKSEPPGPRFEYACQKGKLCGLGCLHVLCCSNGPFRVQMDCVGSRPGLAGSEISRDFVMREAVSARRRGAFLEATAHVRQGSIALRGAVGKAAVGSVRDAQQSTGFFFFNVRKCIYASNCPGSGRRPPARSRRPLTCRTGPSVWAVQFRYWEALFGTLRWRRLREVIRHSCEELRGFVGRRFRAIIKSAEAQRGEQGFASTTRAKAKRSVQPSGLSNSATVLANAAATDGRAHCGMES